MTDAPQILSRKRPIRLLDGEWLLLVWFLTLLANGAFMLLFERDYFVYFFCVSLALGAGAVILFTSGRVRKILFALLYLFIASVPSLMISYSFGCGTYGDCL